MATQAWQCKLCGKRGSVKYMAHAGVWEVTQKLVQAHRLKSKDCPAYIEYIRVMSSVRGKRSATKRLSELEETFALHQEDDRLRRSD